MKSNLSKRVQVRREFRRMLAEGHRFEFVGAHNGLTAKLVEEAGFDGVWASGFEISASHCLPDRSILGLEEFLRSTVSIGRAVDLPVLADCDTGFGGPWNAAFTACEFERGGATGVCFEDKVFPKENSFSGRAQVLVHPLEFAKKIEMACKARSDPNFLIIARTEALIADAGMDEALERGMLYQRAGADALVVHSRESTEGQLVEFAERTKTTIPLVAIPTMFGHVSSARLFEAGYSIVIFANQGIRVSVKAVREALGILRDAGRAAALDDRMVPVREIFRLQGVE